MRTVRKATCLGYADVPAQERGLVKLVHSRSRSKVREREMRKKKKHTKEVGFLIKCSRERWGDMRKRLKSIKQGGVFGEHGTSSWRGNL